MTDLDELYSQIPTDQIAQKLGVDAGEADSAIKTLVPVLVGSLHQNAQDPGNAANIESAVSQHAASGLLNNANGAVNVDEVDQNQGNTEISRIFGGNDTSQVASSLAGAGAGNSELIQKLLPVLVPIVLAYIGKQLTQKAGTPAPATQGNGGALGQVLGSILGGGSSPGAGTNNPLGSILGSVLGNKQGGALGQVLGGLLGGKS